MRSHRTPQMTHQFSQVPRAEIPRSSFDRSHGHKTTFDAGWLIPVFLDEALPGDTFKLRMTGFARLATPIFPIMDNIYLDSFFFSVPYRLIWNNWQKFNGEQENPGDSTDYQIPQTMSPAVDGYQPETLEDYMGLPTQLPNIQHSVLFQRAYNLIWNEWFRDQNMQNSVTVKKDDGPDSPSLYTLLKRGKRHDYFTSALPWPQKGPAVDIPLGLSAPVLGLGNSFPEFTTSATGQTGPLGVEAATPNVFHNAGSHPGASESLKWGDPALYADLTNATAATINSLRQAFQIQRIFERDARGGTRYTELIKSHFGVTSPDARLQRPEYLGGGSTPVNVSPIPQTSGTGNYTPTPQGNLAAMGTSLMTSHGFTTSFTEHCLVIGMVSARADMTYQQGLNRMWSRKTRFEFYWPALSHIGEQAILQKEIFASGIVEDDDKVFGYQERYAEYRYKPSQITGLFRSNAPQSLDTWHLAQDFANAPVLGEAFISENPPIDRVIAVPSEPHFLFDTYFQFRCTRPMPMYGVPGMMDHF